MKPTISAVCGITSLLLVAGCTSNTVREADGTYILDEKGCKVFNPFPKSQEKIAWSGACEGGYAQGEGTVKWHIKGNVFETDTGKFNKGKLDGEGEISKADGDRYKGNFKNYEYHGSGTKLWGTNNKNCKPGPCNKLYKGEWSNGQMHGNGVMEYWNGDTFEGSWKNGNPVGMNKAKAEKDSYAKAKSGDSVESYNRYINEYPNGKYVDEAKSRIIFLTEKTSFSTAKAEDTVESYKMYINENPQGKYLDEAKTRISFLSSTEGKQWKKDWKRVKAEVEAINAESRRIGNEMDIRFISFESGVLTVGIPDEGAISQGLQLLFGSFSDYHERRVRYRTWQDSILARLREIKGVSKVVQG